MIQILLLYLILVTLLTYTFVPWKPKKGVLTKPNFKTILIWWLGSALLVGIFIIIVGTLIFT
jgi:hypothetical protein|tara:strand:- start:244 stop:429 length:186 start_codon:yes stop_codon:yes gene_type:complete